MVGLAGFVFRGLPGPEETASSCRGVQRSWVAGQHNGEGSLCWQGCGNALYSYFIPAPPPRAGRTLGESVLLAKYHKVITDSLELRA